MYQCTHDSLVTDIIQYFGAARRLYGNAKIPREQKIATFEQVTIVERKSRYDRVLIFLLLPVLVQLYLRSTLNRPIHQCPRKRTNNEERIGRKRGAQWGGAGGAGGGAGRCDRVRWWYAFGGYQSEEHTSELQSHV